MNVIHYGPRYQRAFLDFFEDELVRYGYDWKTVVIEYMLKGPEPLIFGGIGGGTLLHFSSLEILGLDESEELLTKDIQWDIHLFISG